MPIFRSPDPPFIGGARPWVEDRRWAKGEAAAPAGFKGAWAARQSKLIGASMYPRNAASPQRIAIGPVVQISDGAVQTSGVAVTMRGQGGAEAAATNAPVYSTAGTVLITPTQAETNFASFLVEASKAGCIPATVTVVTSASGVAGYAGLDWATINAATTAQGLTGTTIAASQVVASVTGAVGSVTAGVNATQIDGSAPAAVNLKAHALRAVSVTFAAGGTTTAAVLDLVDGAAASATNDVYNGRVLIFSAPAGLKDQATSITAYVGATKTATIVGVTAAVVATAAAVMV